MHDKLKQTGYRYLKIAGVAGLVMLLTLVLKDITPWFDERTSLLVSSAVSFVSFVVMAVYGVKGFMRLAFSETHWHRKQLVVAGWRQDSESLDTLLDQPGTEHQVTLRLQATDNRTYLLDLHGTDIAALRAHVHEHPDAALDAEVRYAPGSSSQLEWHARLLAFPAR